MARGGSVKEGVEEGIGIRGRGGVDDVTKDTRYARRVVSTYTLYPERYLTSQDTKGGNFYNVSREVCLTETTLRV